MLNYLYFLYNNLFIMRNNILYITFFFYFYVISGWGGGATSGAHGGAQSRGGPGPPGRCLGAWGWGRARTYPRLGAARWSGRRCSDRGSMGPRGGRAGRAGRQCRRRRPAISSVPGLGSAGSREAPRPLRFFFIKYYEVFKGEPKDSKGEYISKLHI